MGIYRQNFFILKFYLSTTPSHEHGVLLLNTSSVLYECTFTSTQFRVYLNGPVYHCRQVVLCCSEVFKSLKSAFRAAGSCQGMRKRCRLSLQVVLGCSEVMKSFKFAVRISNDLGAAFAPGIVNATCSSSAYCVELESASVTCVRVLCWDSAFKG